MKQRGVWYVLRQIPGELYRNTIRPVLPVRTGSVVYNGVRVDRDMGLLDPYVPSRWHDVRDKPDYENALVQLQKNETREGDHVVVCGSGYGVSTYYAAVSVGDGGQVVAYEGSRRRVDITNDTLRRYGVEDVVDVRHAIIGDGKNVARGASAVDHVDPKELPPCDVLEIDVEGDEEFILSNMEISPRDIYVEIHPHDIGRSVGSLLELLRSRGYVIRKYMGENGVEMDETTFFEFISEYSDRELVDDPRHAPLVWASRTTDGS